MSTNNELDREVKGLQEAPWHRYVGAPLPGVDFPDMRRVLVQGFVASDYDVNWLIRELTTSAAYTQEMMFR